HVIAMIEFLDDAVLRSMIDERFILEHRARALTPDRPTIRGAAQNPDVFFQERERANPFYSTCPGIVQQAMDRFERITGRRYSIFEYEGDPEAERVIVLMGSGCETVQETARYLNAKNEKVGVVKVRLFRPFDTKAFLKVLPPTVRAVAVLDRTKEPGAIGDPLYLDCSAAVDEGIANGWISFSRPKVVGGRYGLSSKEFTPAMAKSVYENLAEAHPKNHFTIGIRDDVSGSSLDFDPGFSIEPDSTVRALFYGLGSDGTVGANKNSVKIVGENTGLYVQGYFVYDSKKSGASTVSHL